MAGVVVLLVFTTQCLAWRWCIKKYFTIREWYLQKKRHLHCSQSHTLRVVDRALKYTCDWVMGMYRVFKNPSPESMKHPVRISKITESVPEMACFFDELCWCYAGQLPHSHDVQESQSLSPRCHSFHRQNWPSWRKRKRFAWKAYPGGRYCVDCHCYRDREIKDFLYSVIDR